MDEAQVQQWVTKYAPELWFHPDEAYFPTSVDAYLAQAQLVQTDGSGHVISTSATGVNPANLPTGPDAGNYYLQIDPKSMASLQSGSLQDAEVYVHVIAYPDTTSPQYFDLQYWVFYAFRGPSIGRFSSAGNLWNSFAFDLTPCGSHQGDWKHVTVRVDTDGNLLGVFYSTHSWGSWYSAAEANIPGGFVCRFNLPQQQSVTPLVYVARGSHSCFIAPNLTLQELGTQRNYGVVNFSIVEETGASPPSNANSYFPTGSACQIVSGLSDAAPAWLAYGGEWGPPQPSQQIGWPQLQKAIASGLAAFPVASPAVLLFFQFFGPSLFKWDQRGPSTPAFQPAWEDDASMALAGQFVIRCLAYPSSNFVLAVKAAAPTTVVQATANASDPMQLWNVYYTFNQGSFFGMVLFNVGYSSQVGKPYAMRQSATGRQVILDTYGGQDAAPPDPRFVWVPVGQFPTGNSWVLNKDASQGVLTVPNDQNGTDGGVVIVDDWSNLNSQHWGFQLTDGTVEA